MGVVAIACYRPKEGKDAALMALMKTHLPILREQGLVEDVPSICGRAKDGTVVEVFVWKSQDAIDAAHANDAVLAMWNDYNEVCDYVTIGELAEAKELFTPLEFVPLD